jgi:hypothetical protein
MLQRHRGLFQMVENADHIVWNRAHHEAIEQRDVTIGPGSGQNPPGGQKLEIRHRFIEARLPYRGVFFH